MKNFILIFTGLIFLIGCKEEIKPEEPAALFERYKGSVVLIVNEFYYEVTAGSSVVYYSPNTEEKFFTDETEVMQKPSLSFGSGFIMSDDGKILTNRHVVNPIDEKAEEEVVAYFTGKKEWLEYMVQTTDDTLANFRYYFDDSSSIVKPEQRDRWTFVNLLMYNGELNSELEKIKDIDFSNATYNIVYRRLGIAYNDTHITEPDDLQECVVIRESADDDADLALIQTKTKELNKRPSYYFDFDDHNPNIYEDPENHQRRDIKNPVGINDAVYMIGFNHGLSIALTNRGIQSQFTSGNISQQGNDRRMLYTIPTLEGSSGSPVIDKWGNLVAVNYAKISNTQGFSFGVPVHVVRKFYEGQ
jgi:S1-C subfamily serine protease